MGKFIMTAQQTSFFTQNGYIELEGIPFDSQELFSAAKVTQQPFGRDLWRKSAPLQKLLLRKLPLILFQLTGKPLRLGCDQWVASHLPNKPCPAKDLFCIQGLFLLAIFSASKIPAPTRRLAALGIPPFPLHPNNILFVKPHIVLDWPLIKPETDLYLAAYTHANMGVYVHNLKDPATYILKEFGYEFGDSLVDPHHPAIQTT